MYWRVHGKEIKSDWLDLPLRMQKTTSCRCLLILGIKLLLQKFDANLAAISNYFSIPLRVRDSGLLYCISGEAAEEIWYWSLLGSARENSWRRTCPLPTWPACEKKKESERASIQLAACGIDGVGGPRPFREFRHQLSAHSIGCSFVKPFFPFSTNRIQSLFIPWRNVVIHSSVQFSNGFGSCVPPNSHCCKCC